jgi:hypothetical protein
MLGPRLVGFQNFPSRRSSPKYYRFPNESLIPFHDLLCWFDIFDSVRKRVGAVRGHDWPCIAKRNILSGCVSFVYLFPLDFKFQISFTSKQQLENELWV